MLRTVYLHGRLGKKFGRSFQLAVGSPAEAVRALSILLPGFSEFIRPRRYTVTVGDGTAIPAEALGLNLGRGRDIHITPAGAVGGIETILFGVTLLVAAISVVSIIAMPKAATPSSREDATKTASFMFDGAQNVTEQGHPVPLIYGRFRTGSVVVSAGISTADVNDASLGADPTDPTFNSGYTGYIGSSPGVTGSANGNVWLAKGGKAGSSTTRAAQEDPNNLQSVATAKILDAISEGEIRGLVAGMQSVYFDETPVQNADGSFNFAGVAIEARVGLPDQDFVPGFSQTENTISIDTKVAVSTGPVTRTISDPDATVARVTIRLPQLYAQDTTNGDLKTSTVEVSISVQADGGGFTTVTNSVFDGKTTGGYQRSIDIRLPNGTQRDIRVTRVTPDSTLTSLQNETRFDLLTEIVEAKLSYPDTALIGITVDARQFGTNIPTRSFDVYGLIIEVPSNYDPIARTYAGVWDGTFKRAWTDNPAWVFRDILVNRRYGLGARIAASAVDIWGLYAIAQYCDGMVPDGFGGQQPRYTVNCSITEASQAYDLIAAISSNFRAFTYWGSGSVIAVQDSPLDPSVLITPSNIVGGQPRYGRITAAEKRRSVAIVYWNDPDDGYKLTPEIFEDPALVRRFGRRSGDEVTAFGVTNRGQAHRMARWLLEDEAQGSNSSVEYDAGDDHAFVSPGDVASIADPMFTQSRRGGRVIGAGSSTLELDAPVSFVSGSNYFMRVMLPNGQATLRPITNGPGTTNIVTLGGAGFNVPPLAGAVWSIESDQVANRQFRIRNLQTDAPPYTVQAVLHDPTKYDRVELERDISTPNYLDLPSGPLAPPGAMSEFEFLLQDGNSSIPCVQVSWIASPDPRVTFYQAQFQRPNSPWEAFADSIDLSRTVRGTEFGSWNFRVRALDSLGGKTAWVQLTASLHGQVSDIPNVIGLAVMTDDKALQSMLVWVSPADTRPLRSEVFLNATDNNFTNAVLLATIDTQEYVVSAEGTYWVRERFIDAVSDNPPSITIGAGDLPVVRYDDGTTLDYLKPATTGATAGAPPGTYVGSTLSQEIEAKIAQLMEETHTDTVPPGKPTGLGMTSTITSDGSADVTFGWTPPSDDDIDHYELDVATNGGNYVAFNAPGATYTFHGIAPNTPIMAQVRAVDRSGNLGAFSDAYSGSTAVDTTPPNPPTALTITPSIQNVFLGWTNDTAPDVVGARIYESTDPTFVATAGGSGAIGVVNGVPGGVSRLTRSGLLSGVAYYYFVSNIDSSGNESAPAGPISASTLKIGTGDISAASITGALIAGQTITGDNILAGSVTADRLQSGSSLPATLTIGNTGYSLSTVTLGALSPDGQNLVPYSDFQVTDAYWGVFYNPQNMAFSTSSGTYMGRRYMNVNFVATGYNQIIDLTSTPTVTGDINYTFPIDGNAYYSMGAFFAGSNVYQTLLRIWWYDVNGFATSNAIGAVDLVVPFSQSNQFVGQIVQAPAGAIRARLEWYGYSNASGSGALTCCNPMVTKVPSANSPVAQYNPGPNPNAALVVNANTTLIGPGKIQLTGATTLTSWLYGGDNTLINGGAVAANTITANKLTVGLRGVNFVDIAFQVSQDRSTLTWTSGYVQWTDDSGNPQQNTIASGSVTGGGYWYVYWTQGFASLNVTTDASFGRGQGNWVNLCTWQSGQPYFVANFGRTIIDGSQITTGTVYADRLVAHSITGSLIAAGTLTGDLIAANTIYANSIMVGTITADRFLTNAGVDLAAIVPGSFNFKTSGSQNVNTVSIPKGTFYGPFCGTGLVYLDQHEVSGTVFGTFYGQGGNASNGDPINATYTVYLAYNTNGAGWQYAALGTFSLQSTNGRSIAFDFQLTGAAGNTQFGLGVTCVDNGGGTSVNGFIYNTFTLTIKGAFFK